MGIIRSGGRLFDVSTPVAVIGAGACGCSAALAATTLGRLAGEGAAAVVSRPRLDVRSPSSWG